MNSKVVHILFFPLDAYGHIHSCIGIAEKLAEAGHRVTFALEKAWSGQLKKYGFEEAIYTDRSRPPNLKPNEYWANSMDLIMEQLPKDSLYKASHQNIQEFEEFVFSELNFDEQLSELITTVKPDLIVSDNYVTIPAVYKSNIKWIQMFSAHPLSAISHPDTPPQGSGYAIDSDRALWKVFEDASMEHHGEVIERFRKRITELGLPELPEDSLYHPSPYLNIYAYPEELDYLAIRPLAPKWKRFDHFIRSSEQKVNFALPEKLQNLPGKLIYVSMGSMGCADLRLTNRLNSIFATMKHRFIMVLGRCVGQVELASNVWGDRMLPQTAILPMVDLVISHGGNNSVLECLYYGKPMIINPLFYDQYDNAQRVTETHYGQRVNLYTCTVDELKQMIDQILADTEMSQRCQAISRRLQSSCSTQNAAQAIINVAISN